MPLNLTSLKNAVAAMAELIEKTKDPSFLSGLDDITAKAVQAGCIQYFEFTYELCWKFIQRWIENNQNREEAKFPRSRKEFFRLAAKYSLIADPEPWFEYADARNLTSHTYNSDTARQVFEVATRFVDDAATLLVQLEASND